jgi:hypothetical protein
VTNQIHVRLYEELNDFLPVEKRKLQFEYPLNGIETVEDLLQALGVPRSEVEFALVNGEPAEFAHRLSADDRIGIYPVFESLDVSSVVRVRGRSLRRTRFIVGPDLVRLGFYLRLLGFDARNSGSWPREQMVQAVEDERRILLTKDACLLKRPELSRIFLVKGKSIRRQLSEVFARFDLYNTDRFSLLQSLLARIFVSKGVPFG